MSPEYSAYHACSNCPERLILPDDLSGATAAQLVDLLYAIASVIETRYYSQIHRYYQEQREQPQPPRRAIAQISLLTMTCRSDLGHCYLRTCQDNVESRLPCKNPAQ